MQEIKESNWEAAAKALDREVYHVREMLENERKIFREVREMLTKDYNIIQKIKLDETGLTDTKLELTQVFHSAFDSGKQLGILKERLLYSYQERFKIESQIKENTANKDNLLQRFDDLLKKI